MYFGRSIRSVVSLLVLPSALIVVQRVESGRPLSSGPTVVDCGHEAGCPDPGSGGEPCGDACPCSCCHRHTRTPLLAIGTPTEIVVASIESGVDLPESPDPGDFDRRIFHPPRLAA